MKLYVSPRAPNPRRVQMFIAEKGIAGIADFANDLGINLCLEVLNRFENHVLNTAAEGVAFVKEVGKPNVKVMLVEDEEPSGPFGAKSVGEIATVPVASAVVNAVNWALGTHLAQLPLTPASIISSIK